MVDTPRRSAAWVEVRYLKRGVMGIPRVANIPVHAHYPLLGEEVKAERVVLGVGQIRHHVRHPPGRRPASESRGDRLRRQGDSDPKAASSALNLYQ